MKTCPRRVIINNPWISVAFTLYRHTDGELGVAFLDMPNRTVAAVGAVVEAVNARLKRESEAK